MSFIQVPTDGAGKQVETNQPDGTTHRQVVTVGDKTTAANVLGVDASGRATVNIATSPVPVRPTDGTNAVTQTFDLDTGAGTDFQLGVSLRKAASGGSVELGTGTNPIRTDPTGTTVQPVSGTVSVSGTLSDNITQLAGTAVDVNSGLKSAGTLRVVLATDQPQLTNALKVDGSAVTQPVSAASLPLPAGASTSAKQPALGTAGTASTDVISIQGISGMTAVKVDGSAVTQPVSGTVTTSPPANASTNVTQLAGTAVDANSGLKSAGTLRVTLATDQVQLTNALKVDGSAVTQPVSGTVTANQGGAPWSENVSQFGGSAVATGVGASGAGVPRVTVANDSNVLATQSGTWTVQPGNTPNTAPWLSTINQGGNSVTVSAAGALKVDGSAVTQPVSGTVSVSQVTEGTVAPMTGIQVGGNDGSYFNNLLVDSAGRLSVSVSSLPPVQVDLSASGDPMRIMVEPGEGKFQVMGVPDAPPIPASANATPMPGGVSNAHLVSAATTNATLVKSGPGRVYGWSIGNTSAAIRYVKLHNTAVAPTAGSAVKQTIFLPASGGSNYYMDSGLDFNQGIGFTTVTGAADSDTTAVGANDLLIEIFYK
jgi:endonuclease V-like protein UPF0215 family